MKRLPYLPRMLRSIFGLYKKCMKITSLSQTLKLYREKRHSVCTVNLKKQSIHTKTYPSFNKLSVIQQTRRVDKEWTISGH